MLIAIDIGNTNIVIGGIQGDAIQFEARIATDRIKTSDQYGVEIKNILALFGVKPCDVDDCIISSVVPPVFNSVYTGLVKMTGKHPLVVGPGIKTGLNIQMDVPSQVGSDRIVIAVAALAEYEPPLTLLDLGTATTFNVVDENRVFRGGVICPGLSTGLRALGERCAQLPQVHLSSPKNAIGTNTESCMLSGSVLGTAVLLDGRHIGSVSAYLEENGTAWELGWIISREAQGCGYAAEAARALMDYCLETTGIRRFIAHCDSENSASQRVMQKLGLSFAEERSGRKNRGSDEVRSEMMFERVF